MVSRKRLFGFILLFSIYAVQTGLAMDERDLILFNGQVIDTSKEPSPAISSLGGGSPEKIYLVVKFDGPLSKDQKKKLSRIGAELLNYIPHYTFIVRTQKPVVSSLKGMDGVRWVGEYTARFKIAPKLLSQEADNPDLPVALTIRLFKGEDSVRARSFVVNHGGKILSSQKGLIKIKIGRRMIQPFSEMREVEWIEEAPEASLLYIQLEDSLLDEPPSTPVTGNYDDLSGFESGVNVLRAQAAYQHGITGQRQIVAVADSGLDRGKVAPDQLLKDFQNQVIWGMSKGPFDHWADFSGHGTHVSGSILGTGAYSGGHLSGVAYDSKLIVQSVAAEDDQLQIPPDLMDLFEPVYRGGARVHSNSWALASGGYNHIAQSLDAFVWEHPDLVVVVAAGNDGRDADGDGVIDEASLASPAVAKNCISVGASENIVSTGGIQRQWGQLKDGQKKWGVEPIASDRLSDNENGLAAFSSRGPTTDGRLKPDLVAPGTNILSARSQMEGASVMWGAFDRYYVWSGGTSMATPLVAGSATLIRQFYEDYFNKDWISAALIKATLVNGADDLYPGQFGFGNVREIPTPRPNIHEGWGRVNIEKALFPTEGSIRVVDEKKGIATSETKIYRISVTSDDSPLRVTMVYSDYPGAVQASETLVNDIDLEVIDEAGHHFYPNRLKQPDRLNNTEMVEIDSPLIGAYQLKVTGHHVPRGNEYDAQPFAIVASGALE